VPAPDPSPATTTATTTAVEPGVYVLHPQQFASLGFGLVLVVLLLSALVMAQLRRG
jgi:hypothetical protein